MAVFAESLEARCQVENEDVVGAAPTGDAPTTSEWSTNIAYKGASYIRDFTVVGLILRVNTDTTKLTSPWTFADKKWVGPVKLLCIIMFNISKIRSKSLLGPVKAQQFSQFLLIYHTGVHIYRCFCLKVQHIFTDLCKNSCSGITFLFANQFIFNDCIFHVNMPWCDSSESFGAQEL